MQQGDNRIRWTVTVGTPPNECIDFHEIILTNSATTPADAGQDRHWCADNAILEGNFPTYGVGVWSSTNTTISFTIPNASAFNATVNNLQQGSNLLRWTISTANCSDWDEVLIFNDIPTIPIAAVDLVDPREICDYQMTLNANDPAIGEGIWTVTNGNGVFSNDTRFNTDVTNILEDENIYRWTINNGVCQDVYFDEITIINNVVNSTAGLDEEVCGDPQTGETYTTLDGNPPV